MSVGKLPPGPRSWVPGRVFWGLRRDPLGFLTELTRRYGDICSFSSLGRRYVVLNHPDFAREVLLTQADAFWKGPALQNSKDLLGDGLLTAEGEAHKCQRRLMQPAFHAKRVESYAGDVVECARRTCEGLMPPEGGTPNGGSSNVVDIRSVMMRLTLVIAGRTLFGSLLEEETELVGRSMEVLMGNYSRTVVPWGKVLNRLPLRSTLLLRRAQVALRGLVERMIAKRRGEVAWGAEKKDLLSTLIGATDVEGGKGFRLTDTQLRDQAITILTAGHETTANAMTFTLWLLAKYPEEQEKLRGEVREVLAGREPGVGDMERLVRTRWVLSESMRLLPPAWTIGRQNQRAVEIGGYVLPARCTVLVPQWTLHRDERFFPGALAFRPERWGDSQHPRFSYLPFSTGPRNCIGESFAWVEMMLALPMLLQKVRFELVEGSGEMGLMPAITLRPREAVRVRVVGIQNQ